MRAAILDLGTNTFNLVIADSLNSGEFRIVCNQKLPVKLGEGRINEGEIIPAAFERGIQAVTKHFKRITKLKADHIRAFGTSALRSATNGQAFLDKIKSETGIEVEIINGEREAELIYKGVRQTIQMNNEKLLMLDIGGGSNELIIANHKSIYWKKSYELGIARLLERFKPSDPITNDEIDIIRSYLKEQLTDLFQSIKKYNVKTLVGASGSFETFSAMIRGIDADATEEALEPKSFPISLKEFDILYKRLIRSTVSERKVMRGLEPMRIEMIPLAALFVKVLVDESVINRIVQSNFALKEGVLAEMLNY